MNRRRILRDLIVSAPVMCTLWVLYTTYLIVFIAGLVPHK